MNENNKASTNRIDTNDEDLLKKSIKTVNLLNSNIEKITDIIKNKKENFSSIGNKAIENFFSKLEKENIVHVNLSDIKDSDNSIFIPITEYMNIKNIGFTQLNNLINKEELELLTFTENNAEKKKTKYIVLKEDNPDFFETKMTFQKIQLNSIDSKVLEIKKNFNFHSENSLAKVSKITALEDKPSSPTKEEDKSVKSLNLMEKYIKLVNNYIQQNQGTFSDIIDISISSYFDDSITVSLERTDESILIPVSMYKKFKKISINEINKQLAEYKLIKKTYIDEESKDKSLEFIIINKEHPDYYLIKMILQDKQLLEITKQIHKIQEDLEVIGTSTESKQTTKKFTKTIKTVNILDDHIDFIDNYTTRFGGSFSDVIDAAIELFKQEVENGNIQTVESMDLKTDNAPLLIRITSYVNMKNYSFARVNNLIKKNQLKTKTFNDNGKSQSKTKFIVIEKEHPDYFLTKMTLQNNQLKSINNQLIEMREILNRKMLNKST